MEGVTPAGHDQVQELIQFRVVVACHRDIDLDRDACVLQSIEAVQSLVKASGQSTERIVGLSAGPVTAQSVVGPAKEYVVIGTGAIYKGNTANARQAAIDNGLDVAVAAAVVELVPSDYLVGPFSAVSRSVSGRSADFLQGYKVLAETPVGDEYRVIVSATVSLDALRQEFDTAGVSLSRKAMPRTLALVVEKSDTYLVITNVLKMCLKVC